MLVLSRKLNETIIIDGGIRITVVGLRGNQIRLGIEAPDQIGIYREELHFRKQDAGACAGKSSAASLRPPVRPGL